MQQKDMHRNTITKLRLLREGRVALHNSICGYKEKKFFTFFKMYDENEFILYSGNDTKISIQKIPLSCSADIDYMLTQIALQMAKRGYEPLSSLGFRKWPTIYE